MNTPFHYAGCPDPLPYKIVVKLTSAEPTRNYLIARFIEFWCMMNCTELWNVAEQAQCIIVGFDDAIDATMFKLSPDSDLV
jgi:hypothetical protein